jgi:hypothetical protein
MSISKGETGIILPSTVIIDRQCAVDVEGVAQRSNIIRLAIAAGTKARWLCASGKKRLMPFATGTAVEPQFEARVASQKDSACDANGG